MFHGYDVLSKYEIEILYKYVVMAEVLSEKKATVNADFEGNSGDFIRVFTEDKIYILGGQNIKEQYKQFREYVYSGT